MLVVHTTSMLNLSTKHTHTHAAFHTHIQTHIHAQNIGRINDDGTTRGKKKADPQKRINSIAQNVKGRQSAAAAAAETELIN